MSDQAETRSARMRRALLAGIGGLAAATASLGYAVYQARTAPGTPEIAIGQPVEAGRWLVTLRGAGQSPLTPDGLKPFNGAFVVTVDADFLNRSGASSIVFGQVLRLVDPPPGVDPRPAMYLKRDAAMSGALQPRLPETLVAAWTYPPGATPPASIRVSLTGDRFKPKDNLYSAPGWFNPQVVGMATLDVAGAGAP